MNRRNFFRRVAQVAAAVAAAPTVLANISLVPAVSTYEFILTSTPITAKPMKLKAVWSEEADQNLQAMYNIKAEKVLLQALDRRVYL